MQYNYSLQFVILRLLFIPDLVLEVHCDEAGLGCWKSKVRQGWVAGKAKWSRVGLLEDQSGAGLGCW